MAYMKVDRNFKVTIIEGDEAAPLHREFDNDEIVDALEKLGAPCDKCRVNDRLDFHECPYAVEIYDDHEEICDCCDECTSQCAMNI
jgi:hypothetical protein